MKVEVDVFGLHALLSTIGLVILLNRAFGNLHPIAIGISLSVLSILISIISRDEYYKHLRIDLIKIKYKKNN